MADDEEEEEEEEEEEGVSKCKWPVTVYVDEGKLLFRAGKLQKAMKNFNAVLERQPNNVDILVNRSRASYQLMDYDQAMADIDAALIVDPMFSSAICQKGEIQYITGDFEFAYLTFQRGYRNRPSCRGFRLGFQKCRAAILNAIGPQSNLHLTDKDVEMVEARIKDKTLQYISGRTALVPTATVKSVTNFRILGVTEKDKVFMEDTLKSKHIHENVDPYDTDVQKTIKQALQFLKAKCAFWQMEKPLHSRVRTRYLKSKYQIAQNDKEMHKIVTFLNKADKILNQIDELAKTDPQTAIGRSLKLINFLTEIDESKLPNKFQLLSVIYGTLGKAHRQEKDVESAIEAHENQRSIAEMKGFEDLFYESIYNLGQDYIADDDFIHAKDLFKTIFPIARNDADQVNALSGIAICEMNTANYDSANDNLKKALKLSKDAEDLNLETKVTVLFGQFELMQGHVESALEYLESARMVASVAGDEETAKDMERIIEGLNRPVDDDDNNA